MGKTLLGILEIAAAIAVQFIPGLGTVAGIALGVSLAASGFTTLLTKSPKPTLTEQPLKTSRPPRVSAYGMVRLQPAWALFETAPNGWACDAYVFHDGRIDGIIDHYIGDKKVSILSGGWVEQIEGGAFGSGNNNVQVEWRLGLPTETAFGSLIYNIPDHWTTNHRGDGCVTGCMLSKNVKSKDWQTIYSLGGPNNAPLNLSMRAQVVFDWRDPSQSVTDQSTWKFSENAILHLAHYLLMRKETAAPNLANTSSDAQRAALTAAYWAQIGAVWNLKFAPTLDYWTAAANDADIAMPLKLVQTILAGKANSGDSSVNVYSTNGLSPGMTIEIYVSGDSSKTETLTVSSISGPFVHFSGGLSYTHAQGSQVTWGSDPANPATEPRYRSCVAHEHTDAHKDVIKHLIDACDGWIGTRADGAYVVYSGRYAAPGAGDHIGPDDILSYSLQEGVNEEDAINTLKVNYVSLNHDFNTVDTDDWTDEDDIEARGKQLSDSLENQVPSHSQARRLAKRKMAQLLAPYRGTTQLNAAGIRRVIGKRYVSQELTEAGTTFFNGPIEITKLTRTIATGGGSIEWVAADPNIDEWNPATEEGNPAPVGNRSPIDTLTVPIVTAATPNFGTDSATGVQGVFIDLTAEGPNRDDLIWYIRTRQSGFVSWNTREYDDVAPGSTVELSSEFVPTDAMIEVEVSYETGDGRVSDWSDTSTVNTSSANVPPARVTGFSVVGGTASATATWNNPTSANLAYEKLYRSASPSFTAATLVDTYADRAGTASSHAFTDIAGNWYAYMTTVSTGGAESTPVGPVPYTVT